MRRGNTGREIVESGEFLKTGKKEYTHRESGEVIRYDCNKWVWRTPDGLGFTALHGAVSWLRKGLEGPRVISGREAG